MDPIVRDDTWKSTAFRVPGRVERLGKVGSRKY